MLKAGVRGRACSWTPTAPDDDHWWFRLAEEERPEGWEFWSQPAGLVEEDGEFRPNPKAENIKYLPADYYMQRKAGKGRDYVLVYYCNQYGFIREGRAVYPEFQDHVHTAKDILSPIPDRTVYVGIDFGLTPAAVLMQQTVAGQWRWIDEVVTEDIGAVRFAELLGRKLRGEYPDFEFEMYGDPAGEERSQVDERTPFQVLKVKGIEASPAPSNDPTIRREAVAAALGRMIDGEPGLLVSPKCKVTRKGMAGGYRFRRIQVANEERYTDHPVKDKYSHPCEAAQYAMLGAGEGRAIIRKDPKRRRRNERAIEDYKKQIRASIV